MAWIRSTPTVNLEFGLQEASTQGPRPPAVEAGIAMSDTTAVLRPRCDAFVLAKVLNVRSRPLLVTGGRVITGNGLTSNGRDNQACGARPSAGHITR
jgi:hypothetical protein